MRENRTRNREIQSTSQEKFSEEEELHQLYSDIYQLGERASSMKYRISCLTESVGQDNEINVLCSELTQLTNDWRQLVLHLSGISDDDWAAFLESKI